MRSSVLHFSNFVGAVAARPVLVVRAEEAAAEAPAKKPEVGPKRGTQVRSCRSDRGPSSIFDVL